MITVDMNESMKTAWTCLQGFIENVTYPELEQVFGKPNRSVGEWDGDDKTDTEWAGTISDPENGLDDEPFTIYNYYGQKRWDTTSWNIGGKIGQVAIAVKLYFLENYKREVNHDAKKM